MVSATQFLGNGGSERAGGAADCDRVGEGPGGGAKGIGLEGMRQVLGGLAGTWD